jgi:D,D-heptose 1,7-bisphosphate phosphatase
MPERAIFLDRDNTIIENDGYLGDASKVKLLPGAGTALSSLRRLGYKLIVVSNQSGVARGMFSENDVESVNQEMCRQLIEQAQATIDASYYCPYHPEAKIAEYRVDHDWRKPKPGMLRQAAEDFSLELNQCWMIGDAPRDIAAGAAAGCRTILLRDPDHPNADEANGSANVSPNFIVRSLADAARIIAREGRGLVRDPAPTLQEKPAAAAPAPQPAAPAQAVAAPVASAAPFPPLPRTDESAIANRVAEIIARAQADSSAKHDKVLDELLIQMRHAQRQHDYQPEFSLSTLAAIILQFAAACVLIVGVVGTLQSGAVGSDIHQMIAVERSHTWMLLGVGLQAMVLVLMLKQRRK